MKPSEYYAKGQSDRKQYEDRAEIIAKMTIPALMRDTSWNQSTTTPDAYGQSFGARCVNSLTSKIGMTLFPPNATAFRLTPNAELMKKAVGDNPKIVTETNKALSSVQTQITEHLEALNTRNTIFDVLQHMIVVSSAILEKKKDSYKVHTLRNFVVSLDDKGDEYKLCVKEILNQVPKEFTTDNEDKDTYELYTQLELVDSKWVMIQEFDGEVQGDEKTYNDDNRPFVYQGWQWTSGDKYHRPYCDSYKGGFEEYATWSKVLTKGGMISSKNITFVDERTGRTRLRDVKQAENGAVLQGRADDVTSYQHGKNYDYQIAYQEKQDQKEILSQAFLLPSTRDSERTTATEIRQDSQELESALASIYSIVSNRLIKRMVIWAMEDLGHKFKTFKIDIVAGLDALGRAVQAQNLDNWVKRGAEVGYMDRINQDVLAQQYASLFNVEVNSSGLLMSDDDYNKKVKAQQDAMAQQKMIEQGAVQTGTNIANKAIPQQ